MMLRLSLVLLVALMVSALYLVRVQYDARSLFAALNKAQAEAQRLESEHDHLEAKKRGAISSLRVEELARARLAMHPATIATTEYVTLQEKKR